MWKNTIRLPLAAGFILGFIPRESALMLLRVRWQSVARGMNPAATQTQKASAIEARNGLASPLRAIHHCEPAAGFMWKNTIRLRLAAGFIPRESALIRSVRWRRGLPAGRIQDE